jgi:hypothetical protein
MNNSGRHQLRVELIVIISTREMPGKILRRKSWLTISGLNHNLTDGQEVTEREGHPSSCGFEAIPKPGKDLEVKGVS